MRHKLVFGLGLDLDICLMSQQTCVALPRNHPTMVKRKAEKIPHDGAASKSVSNDVNVVELQQGLHRDATSQQETERRETIHDPDREGLHAHFDCFSGAAGDMLLACLVDAAAKEPSPNEYLERPQVSSVILERSRLTFVHNIETRIKKGLPDLAYEFHITCQQVWRGSGSIAATHVKVHSVYDQGSASETAAPAPVPSNSESAQANTEPTASAHDHSHHHGHSHNHSHLHSHEHAAATTTPDEVDESQDSVTVRGPLRNLPEIRRMISAASEEFIPPWVKKVAVDAFTMLAQAEASVHGASSIDHVHFHEVGAVDSIVDTIGTILALHLLGIQTVSCSRLPLGQGQVHTAHGLLPVPAPATLYLLQDWPTTPGPPGPTGELVTPTGAAILRALLRHCSGSSSPGVPPQFTIRRVGTGAGTKNFAQHANIVRVLIGDNVVG
jgi:pyridinium-3,5-bisthiocarboxylic acid mononucleotide nickel chelatase